MRILPVALAAAIAAPSLSAQIPVAKDLPDNVAKVFNTKFIKDGGGTIIIPTALVHFSATGSVYDEAKGAGGAAAMAKTRFLTAGLEKSYLQGLARAVQDDLVARLRAAGFKVLLWDDIKSDPAAASLERRKTNEDWGMPTSDAKNGRTYVVAAPGDEQVFAGALTTPTRQFLDIAKKMGNAAVLIPEYYFNSPDIKTKKGGGGYSATIEVDADPSLRMAPAIAWFSNAKGDGGMIQMAGLGYANFMTPVVGTVALVKSQTWKPSLSQINAAFQMDLDQAMYRAATLEHAANWNNVIVKYVAREKK
jgi:hypothetical protein